MIDTIAAALEQRGYSALTPVQAEVTRPEYDGADLLVSAQTGSGKTVGFGLAIAPTLLGEDGRFGPPSSPLALIIAPTRELAMQVKRELAWLYEKAGAVVVSCVGGMDMRAERNALDRGAHIVVATPGRLCDHIKRGSFDTGSLRAIVLDEADEMLDLGFREDLEFILGEAPEDRRTLMFSATVPRAIATLAKQYQRDAIRITTTAEQTQHADIEYRALNVNPHDVENAVINVLRFYEAGNALVFCNTREAVNRLTTRFSNRGFSVVALSGELSQNERSHALQAMRDGRARVCVATDVAARGIDLPGLGLVIHADLPSNSETLLHRSGRTGRAGRKGVSALIVPTRARRKAERLLQGAKVQAQWAEPPSAAEVLAKDEERLLSDPVWQEELTETEREFAGKLLASHSPEQIAAAYLRLHNAKVSAPEELSAPDQMAPARDRDRDRNRDGDRARAPREQQPFGDSVWFSISIGRSRKAEPRWLLPMLCRAGNITAKTIGAIRVHETMSFVEIQARSVDDFLASVGPQMQLESGVRLTRLDGPPDLSAAAPEPVPQRERPDRKPAQGYKPRPQSGPKPKWHARDASGDGGEKPKTKPKWQARESAGDVAGAKPKPKAKWQARDAGGDDAGAKPTPKPKWQPRDARGADAKPKRKLKLGGKQPAKFKGKPAKPKPRDG
jgi:ATP-dependent RNA helicase DeaD